MSAGRSSPLLCTLLLFGLTAGCASREARTSDGSVIEPLSLDAQVAADEVKGQLTSKEGIRILHVSGTHYEMGYAAGRLLAADIMRLLNDYATKIFPRGLYDLARSLYGRVFELPPRYVEELEGMLDGIEASGVSLYVADYDKDLDLLDLQIANSIADIAGMVQFGCSSISAWGAATASDPELAGELVLARNFDWPDEERVLAQSALVVAYHSSDPAEEPLYAVTYPGLIGCMSCMNRSGVVMTYDLGEGRGLDAQGGCTPIHMAIRMGLEREDYNQDGRTDAEDVWQAVEDHERSGGSEIHVAQPPAEGVTDPAFIIEAQQGAMVRRVASDEPDFGPSILAVTNHHRKLEDPMPGACWRYDEMRRMVQSFDHQLSRQRAWAVEQAVAVPSTIQTMSFVPSRREMWLSLASYSPETVLAPFKGPTHFAWSDVFPEAP